MLGSSIILPFLAMVVGALFAMRINGPDGMIVGGAVGFGVGCAILIVIWLLFAILKRMVD
jgi:hypothetical protein